MNIPDWKTYFMDMLELMASRSKDPNTKVGCIITTQDNNIISTGYNSFPRGIDDTIPERLERPEKYFWIEHADRNAIYAAARIGIPLAGCIMYLPGLPCMDCGRAIIQAGIVEVIYDGKKQDEWAKTTPKYVPDFERVQIILKEGGVKLTRWESDKEYGKLTTEQYLKNVLSKYRNKLFSSDRKPKILSSRRQKIEIYVACLWLNGLIQGLIIGGNTEITYHSAGLMLLCYLAFFYTLIKLEPLVFETSSELNTTDGETHHQ